MNSEYWSSPDNDCANFVSQCLAAGGVRPTYDDGREWRADGTEFPTVAWVNCGAQKQALSVRAAGHSRYIARSTGTQPAGGRRATSSTSATWWTARWSGDAVVLAGRQGAEWVYDSHTAAYRHATLDHWYPAHFTEVRFCRIADVVSYATTP